MKTILLAGLVIFGLLRSASAFTLAGPVANGPDTWQVQNIGYGPPSDDVAPKNYGEGFRRNTPVMYYACDATFLQYFGANGMAAVSSAFKIMNSVFTNNPTGLTNGLDGYSTNLTEFSFDTRHVNYQAQASGIWDVKSFVLGILVRQMGLADPVQYDWTLHDRYAAPPGTCPIDMEYSVIMRNFDTGGYPVPGSQTITSLYSPYVNNVLYYYYILEFCTGPTVLARPVPITVDPTANPDSSVATQFGITWGEYYTGLTRDDVMGLRYLLTSKTINTESPVPGALVTAGTPTGSYTAFPSNTNSPSNLGTFDLGALLSSAYTNDPVTLEALFPGVLVGNTITNVGLITNITVFAYFTNFPGSAVGSPPTLVVATNSSFGIGTNYTETFLNVITNHYYSNTVVTLQTVTVGPPPGSAIPVTTIQTNITSTKVTLKGVPSGDYYFIPTNMPCGLEIANVLLTNVISQTNLSSSFFGTNITVATTTNSAGISFTYAQTVSKYTNYVFRIPILSCSQTTNSPGLYRGIQKISFVETYFDDYIGTFYQPITNTYTAPFVNTNGQYQPQTLVRVVTTPDFLFQSADLSPGGGAAVARTVDQVGIPNFDTIDVPTNSAGPGTINPQTIISLDRVGPLLFNNFFELTGTNYFSESPGNSGGIDNDVVDTLYDLYFVWGSFDGSTNAPVVYPDGASIDALEGLIQIQISPLTLPNGIVGTNYPSTTFTASGGTVTVGTYTWSATGLPGGLNLSPGGTLSGTPTQAGSFVFQLTLTNTNNQYQAVNWNYPLIIQ